MQHCLHCGKRLPGDSRSNKKFCNTLCKQHAFQARRIEAAKAEAFRDGYLKGYAEAAALNTRAVAS